MAYADLSNRENLIASYIETTGKMSVNDIIKAFAISPSTARRILARLAKTGAVARTHGGALWVGGAEVEAPVLHRAKIQAVPKDHIASVAAGMIYPGETIILLAGTTINLLAGKLKDKENIKVITNSLPVLAELQPFPNIEIIFLGGLLNRKEQSVGGCLMGLFGSELRADKLFFSVRGITPDYRLTLDDVNERDNFRTFMSSARERIVLADGSKFRQSGTIALCTLAETDTLITDHSAPEQAIADLAGQGVRVVIADQESAESA
jgi:DeoR/GlpR family transcriptional regulator of sugar metabolism